MVKRERETTLIIHIVQHLCPGGIETLALNMLNHALTEQKIIIVSLEGEKQHALEQWPTLNNNKNQIIFLNKPASISTRTLFQLQRLFTQLKPDVVHTHHIGPLLYGGLAAKRSHVPVHIHTEHDAWHLENRKNAWLQSNLLRFIRPKVVADADLVREQLSRHTQYSDIIVIKNGIDCQKFTPKQPQPARTRFNLPINKILIGAAGRLETVKGHDILLQSVAKLPKSYCLAIAGIGSQADKLRQQAEQLNISDRVFFLGLVEDMPSFYQSLDLFCLPSRYEGFPLSPLEAQSCDVITLVTNVGASKETLCPITGGCAKADDPDSLAEHIVRLTEQKKMTSPRQFVLENNSIQQMVSAYNDLVCDSLACNDLAYND
ncbi:glycosyltransferase [Vibrio sinensis]|uniref:Glycosyltransferase n=1 Tax=Vibrio sinensis TaxID=2302434 RepID=A0A3A6QCD6_9VIBR|nr:glycosyltransferase [Vibrio sinensis]RJX66493.1 glycosyltransferase [Vibrio sinensis]